MNGFSRVAIAGRFAFMTHRLARKVIRENSVDVQLHVNSSTSAVVVGQGSWPVSSKRASSAMLKKVDDLRGQGTHIDIISEADFFARLRPDFSKDRKFTAAQVVELSGISSDHLKSLVQVGILKGATTESGVVLFQFFHIRLSRCVQELLNEGISFVLVMSAIRRLLKSPSEATSKLANLKRDGITWIVRSERGQLMDLNGQLFLPFDEDDFMKSVECGYPVDLFHRAWVAECHSELDDAAATYEEFLIKNGPNRDACFNLGNVLFKQRRYDAAAARFRQVLELAPCDAYAWNNLGNCESQLQSREPQAIAAYRKSLIYNSQLPDAHFNLARTLDLTGERSAASLHWRAFLRFDSTSELADHARRRLESEMMSAK